MPKSFSMICFDIKVFMTFIFAYYTFFFKYTNGGSIIIILFFVALHTHWTKKYNTFYVFVWPVQNQSLKNMSTSSIKIKQILLPMNLHSLETCMPHGDFVVTIF